MDDLNERSAKFMEEQEHIIESYKDIMRRLTLDVARERALKDAYWSLYCKSETALDECLKLINRAPISQWFRDGKLSSSNTPDEAATKTAVLLWQELSAISDNRFMEKEKHPMDFSENLERAWAAGEKLIDELSADSGLVSFCAHDAAKQIFELFIKNAEPEPYYVNSDGQERHDRERMDALAKLIQASVVDKVTQYYIDRPHRNSVISFAETPEQIKGGSTEFFGLAVKPEFPAK